MTKTLILNSSVQQDTSASRQLVHDLRQALNHTGQLGEVIERDLAKNEMAFLTAAQVGSFYTPADARTEEQKQIISLSDTLLSELKAADQLIIGAPMYNFGIPAVLKAWIDLICRVGESFRYTDQGPQGLLNIERAYFVIATGGVPIGSAMDFSSDYLKQIARFIGVKESYVIAAEATNKGLDAALENGRQQIALLTSQ